MDAIPKAALTWSTHRTDNSGKFRPPLRIVPQVKGEMETILRLALVRRCLVLLFDHLSDSLDERIIDALQVRMGEIANEVCKKLEHRNARSWREQVHELPDSRM